MFDHSSNLKYLFKYIKLYVVFEFYLLIKIIVKYMIFF
jgi:hypothetical protein